MNDIASEHSATLEEPPGFLLITGSDQQARRVAKRLTEAYGRARVERLRDRSELPAALAAWRRADPDGPLVVIGGELDGEDLAALLDGGADGHLGSTRLERLDEAVQRAAARAFERRRRNNLETELAHTTAMLTRARSQANAAEACAADCRSRLQALLEHAPVALSVTDPRGGYLALSPAAAALTGVRRPEREAIADDLHHPVYAPAASPMLEAHDTTVRATRKAVSFEVAIPGADGTVRDYLCTKYPVLDGDDGLTAIGGIAIDVSDRKHAELIGRALIEAAPAPTLIADRDGRIRLANDAASLLFGYSREALADESIARLLPGLDWATRVAAAAAEGASGADGACYAGRRRDGDEVAVELELRTFGGHRSPLVVATLHDAAARLEQVLAVELSETRFRSAFADAPIGLALVDLEGTLLRVNGALCAIVGFAESDLLTTGLAELTHPDDTDVEAAHVERLLSGEVMSYRVEKRFFNRRGHTIWAGLSVALARDAAGEPLHLVAAIEDISASKTAEASLREANAQLQALFDHAPAWLTLRALDGRYVNANDQLIRSLGTTRHELIGSHPGTHLDADTAAQLHADDHRIWETRAPLTCEIVVTGDGGEPQTFHEIRYPVLDETGEVSAFGSFALDVTDRTRSEAERERALAELRVAEERFRNAFEHAPVGMVLADLEGRFLKVNDALCAMLGYRPDELLATTATSITHPEDVEVGREQTVQLLDGELDHFQREKRLLRAAGDSLWVAVHVSVLRDRDGRPLQFVQQVVDITERRRLEKELRHLADHDPLTGLVNRRGLEAELERHLAHVNRYGDRGALLVLDLDHFKTVNDTLGHEAGDQLIVSVAEILTERLRESDTVARLGGDEFAILLPEADLAAAEDVAAQLVADIHEHAVLSAGQVPRHITASVGVTAFHQGLTSGEEALVNADVAMYEAKEAGRDQLAVHAPDRSEQPRTEARQAWIERIREALEDDQLTLVAQPVVALQGGAVVQHELLLRMVQAGGDAIPPGAFLYIAERYDLVQELDRWVAARAIRLLESGSGSHGALGLNVSARSLADDELIELVESELERSGIEPARLVFEVTETAAVANIQLTRRFAEGLERLGCRFALDDFGAGFGSFYYLKHIPFDFLKIDRELVSGCRTNRTDQLVIESLVAIARGLGKRTVAKGVEDEGTHAFLCATGVDFAQGYHFGHPAPVALPAAANARR